MSLRTTGLAVLCSLFAFAGCQKDKRATSEDAVLEPPPAAKKRPRRGIAGSIAPAWKLENWFNVADGARPEVADYRGKVVFLFFFQSW